MAYAACGHGQNSAKSTWSRWLTPPVDMGKTVQKAPGADGLRRLWPCERSGGAKGFGPLQATCPAPLATRGGLEHVRHLGLGRWLQVASAPPSHLHAPPRHTWRAGARAPPGASLNSETENPSHGRAGCQTRAFPLLPALLTGTVGCVNEGLRRSSAATIDVRRRHKPGASTRPARAFGVAANAAGAGGCAGHAPLQCRR